MLKGLTYESFEAHIGTGFTVHPLEHEEVFTLTEVSRGKPAFEGAREAFALVFNGSTDGLMIESQLMTLRHPAFDDLMILVSPIGRNEDGTIRYEAVFN